MTRNKTNKFMKIVLAKCLHALLKIFVDIRSRRPTIKMFLDLEVKSRNIIIILCVFMISSGFKISQ